MTKVMRIVEPHLYEEFLIFLRISQCSCALSEDKDGGATNDVLMLVTSNEEQEVAVTDTEPDKTDQNITDVETSLDFPVAVDQNVEAGTRPITKVPAVIPEAKTN